MIVSFFRWLIDYLFYIFFLEIKVMQRSCVNCYYYGKYCAFGKGKISSLFFKKISSGNFAKEKISWKDMLPDFLVSIIPFIVGIILLVEHFNLLLLTSIILLVILTTFGNSFIRGFLACKHCKQQELGCHAEQLFNKRKKK